MVKSKENGDTRENNRGVPLTLACIFLVLLMSVQ
jgi:hypothetical protein